MCLINLLHTHLVLFTCCLKILPIYFDLIILPSNLSLFLKYIFSCCHCWFNYAKYVKISYAISPSSLFLISSLTIHRSPGKWFPQFEITPSSRVSGCQISWIPPTMTPRKHNFGIDKGKEMREKRKWRRDQQIVPLIRLVWLKNTYRCLLLGTFTKPCIPMRN